MKLGVTRALGVLLVIAVVGAAVTLPLALRARHARKVTALGRAAREQLAAGETAESLKLYSLYLRHAPNDPEAFAEYAELLCQLAAAPGAGEKQQQAALEAVGNAIGKNPDSLPLRRSLVRTMLSLRQFGAARQEIASLRERVAATPAETLAADGIDLEEIALLEARACVGDDLISEAAAIAGGLSGFDPEGKTFDASWKPGRFVTEASLLLAEILVDKRGDPQAAERVLEKLCETAPNDYRSWLVLARWRAGRGDARGADAAIERAEAIAPDDGDVLAAGFARALADRRFDDAARRADRMRQLFPQVPQGALCLAEVAVRRGQPEQGIEPLREALGRQPGHPAVLCSLANIQLLANRLPDAEETIRGLAERSGRQNPAVDLLEARLLVARREWLAAAKKLDAIRPLVADATELKRQVDLLLVECHARLGQVDEQLAASQRVLSGDVGSRAARVTAAAALAASGRPEKALAEYEAVAAELGPERLLEQPQVWEPLLRLRGVHQLRRPVRERDWSRVTQLLDALETAQALPAARLAVLRYDQLVAAGDPTAAATLLERAVEAHGDDPRLGPQLWERLVIATLARDGFAAAMQAWETIPAPLVGDERLLALRARLAARAPEEQAVRILQELEVKAASLPAEPAGRLLAAVAASRLARGDQAGAERLWQTRLEANPNDLATHFTIFERACGQRDLVTAEREADAISRLCGPDSANGRTVAAAVLLLRVAAGRAASPEAADGRSPRAAQLDAEAIARLDESRNLLVEAENERPGWLLIQQLLADLELIRGDVPAAIGRLERAAELSPENRTVIESLVGLLAGSNRQPQARAVLRQILSANEEGVFSEDLRSWARRGLADLARNGRYRDVEEAVTELVRNQGSDGEPAEGDLLLAVGLLSGRAEVACWRQAVALLESLAARRPLTAAERLQRSILLDRFGRWKECQSDLAALAADADAATGVKTVAMEMLIRRGALEQAADQLKTLADRQPTAAETLLLEVRLAIARKDRAAAAAVVRRLVDEGEAAGDTDRRLPLAAALFEEIGLDDEADAVFRRLADRSAAGVVARVRFLARRDRWAESLDLLEANHQRLGAEAVLRVAVEVVQTAPADRLAGLAGRIDGWFAAARRTAGDAVISLLRADLCVARGRDAEAVALYRQLLAGDELDPSQRVVAMNNLAMRLARPETAAEAKRLIDGAIEEQGPLPSLLDTRGLALLAGGAIGEATDVLREAAVARSPETQLHLACALAAGGDLEEARRILLEARSTGLDPRRLDADDRKRLVDVEAALGIPGTVIPGTNS